MPDNSNDQAAIRGSTRIPTPPTQRQTQRQTDDRPTNPLFAFFDRTLKSTTYRILLEKTPPDAD